jgi:hypothetical protein
MSDSPPFEQSVAHCGARRGHTEISEVLREMYEGRTRAAVTRKTPSELDLNVAATPLVFAALIVQRVGE